MTTFKEKGEIRCFWKYLNLEIGWRYRHLGIRLAFENDRNKKINFSFGLYFISFFFSFYFPFKFMDITFFSFLIYEGVFRWNLLDKDEDTWRSTDSLWKRGSIDFKDLFLGKHKYNEEIIEERNVIIPMPEGTYKATAVLMKSTWKRKLWFQQEMLRVSIDIPIGIPVPGKGSCSWNCGDDATFGIMTRAKTIAEGVGNLVGDCLNTRVKYGGYDNWDWKNQ